MRTDLLVIRLIFTVISLYTAALPFMVWGLAYTLSAPEFLPAEIFALCVLGAMSFPIGIVLVIVWLPRRMTWIWTEDLDG